MMNMTIKVTGVQLAWKPSHEIKKSNQMRSPVIFVT